MGPFEQVQETVASIQALSPEPPDVAVVLGSGLGDFANALQGARSVPYGALPNFPQSSVPGHAGKLVMGRLGDVRVVAMQGRVHAYEGYTPAQVIFPTRVLCSLGIKCLVVTNAAGGINARFQPGDLMVITDHLNFAGWNALHGPNDDRFGPRFPDMSNAYAPSLSQDLLRLGRELKIPLQRGVYAMYGGPSYETPAEIRMLRHLGADAVGMSTVPEVIAANHMGVRVAGISCITNLAAGMSTATLSHQEVAETADRVKDVFSRLLVNFLPIAAKG